MYPGPVTATTYTGDRLTNSRMRSPTRASSAPDQSSQLAEPQLRNVAPPHHSTTINGEFHFGFEIYWRDLAGLGELGTSGRQRVARYDLRRLAWSMGREFEYLFLGCKVASEIYGFIQ